MLMLITSALTFYTCVQPRETPENELPVFTGSAACAGCHSNILEEHIKTPHFLTSRYAEESNIPGSIKSQKEVFYDSRHIVSLIKEDSAFFQVLMEDGKEVRRERMDISVGAGIKGQTYLYWKDNFLFQLPVFHFSLKDLWVNSPGFPNKVIFNRAITSRCLECHSTYAQKIEVGQDQPEQFSRENLVLGIDCEKCHGAASNHVKYHRENPADSAGKFIVSTKGFTRQQKLDMCALCHSGIMINKQPAFSFTPGDRLSDYYAYNTIAADIESLDVHGNQYGLLTLSQCFLQSDLTCNSCHDSHKKETGDILLFSERCMSCHKEEHKKLQGVTGVSLQENCIDCHMPEKESKTIVFHDYSTKEKLAAGMRTHLIKIYPEQTEKIIRYLKQKK